MENNILELNLIEYVEHIENPTSNDLLQAVLKVVSRFKKDFDTIFDVIIIDKTEPTAMSAKDLSTMLNELSAITKKIVIVSDGEQFENNDYIDIFYKGLFDSTRLKLSIVIKIFGPVVIHNQVSIIPHRKVFDGAANIAMTDIELGYKIFISSESINNVKIFTKWLYDFVDNIRNEIIIQVTKKVSNDIEALKVVGYLLEYTKVIDDSKVIKDNISVDISLK